MNPTELRSNIAIIKAKIAAASTAALPEPDLAAALNSELDLLEQGYLAAVAQLGRVVATAQTRRDVGVFRGLSESQRQAIITGAMVRNMREAIFNDVMTAAASWPVNVRMTEAERTATLDKLRRELYRLEYEDERLVEAGQATRREDADPRAVLSLPEDVAFEPRVQNLMEVLQ